MVNEPKEKKKQSELPVIRRGQSDHFKKFFLEHVDSSYRTKFIALMDLIKSEAGADGAITRGRLNAALYPTSTKDSIKVQLMELKKALSNAGIKAGEETKSGGGFILELATQTGRGNENQKVYLKTDAPQQAPAVTLDKTTFMERQDYIPPQAIPVELSIAVSFAYEDHKLAKDLLEGLKGRLNGRTESWAKQIKFWEFTQDIRSGANDHPTIQDAFNRTHLGLLLVSPLSCASDYIQNKEWPLFRNESGKILKPFRAVQLSPVAPEKHNLGVLGDKGVNGRTQLFNLRNEGKNYAWDECIEHPSLKNAFIEALLDEIVYAETSDDGGTSTAASHEKQKDDFQKNKAARSLEYCPEADSAHHVESAADNDSLLTRSMRMLEYVGIVESAHYVDSTAEEFLLKEVSLENVSSKSVFKCDLVPTLKYWACDRNDSPFAVILGEYGMGKTWSSQLLALRLVECIEKKEPNIPIPIYLDLRRAVDEKDRLLGGDVPALEVLLESLSRNNTPPGETPLTAGEIFRYVREEGALLILDGLDEVLAHKRDDAWGQAFIKRLFDVLPFGYWPKRLNPKTVTDNPGKLLLTCRTHYFKSVQTQNDQILGLGREQHKDAKPRAWQLLPFSREQVLKYLELIKIPEQDTQAVYDLIAGVHNLSEIASRPQGLAMVCDHISEIEAARREGISVNGAAIYRLMVDKWLDRDHGKHRIPPEEKPGLMQDLALHMWRLGVRRMPWDDLYKWFNDGYKSCYWYQLIVSKENPEVMLTDLRNATFLVRPGGNDFEFAHTSILEYFLAVRLHRGLEEDDIEIFEDINPSPETLDFLLLHHQTCTSYRQKKVRDALAKHLGQAKAGKTTRATLLDIFLLAPQEWLLKTLDISGLSLERYAFSKLALDMLIADNAGLAETGWTNCNFRRSSWRNADCRQMLCERITGDYADFSHADLFAGRWRNVDIEQTVFDGASHIDTLQQFPAVTEQPQSDLSCRDWRLMWDSHGGQINGCSISADGRRVVTAGYDGTARVWNEKGECIHVLKGHEGILLACSMSADGRRVVTGSSDMIRYWLLVKNTLKCALELHPQTGTVIWLDAAMRTLKLKGPGWPSWQLSHPDDDIRNRLGETIAEFGPMAHEQLANAEDWQFVPRDDIQPD